MSSTVVEWPFGCYVTRVSAFMRLRNIMLLSLSNAKLIASEFLERRVSCESTRIKARASDLAELGTTTTIARQSPRQTTEKVTA